MPEFPVTKMRSPATPSAASRLAASAVGAKCSAASRVVTTRFISSGKGCARSPVRSPASTCPTGMLLVEGRQRARQRGRRIALHQDHIRDVRPPEWAPVARGCARWTAPGSAPAASRPDRNPASPGMPPAPGPACPDAAPSRRPSPKTRLRRCRMCSSTGQSLIASGRVPKTKSTFVWAHHNK